MRHKKSDTPLIKAAVNVWNAFLKYGPVDDGRTEGDNFDTALSELATTIHEARITDSAEELINNDTCPYCEDEEGLDYSDIDGVESGYLGQRVQCPKCGKEWIDVFRLVDRQEITN